jgi:hypothetical protein
MPRRGIQNDEVQGGDDLGLCIADSGVPLLGVSLDLIDRCQNHVLAGGRVRRAYLHHDYATEKREAWAKLGDRIDLLLDSSNVILLTKRA